MRQDRPGWPDPIFEYDEAAEIADGIAAAPGASHDECRRAVRALMPDASPQLVENVSEHVYFAANRAAH